MFVALFIVTLHSSQPGRTQRAVGTTKIATREVGRSRQWVGSIQRFSRQKLATDQPDGDCAGAESPLAVMPGVGGSFSGGCPSGIPPVHACSRTSRDNALGSCRFLDVLS